MSMVAAGLERTSRRAGAAPRSAEWFLPLVAADKNNNCGAVIFLGGSGVSGSRGRYEWLMG